MFGRMNSSSTQSQPHLTRMSFQYLCFLQSYPYTAFFVHKHTVSHFLENLIFVVIEALSYLLKTLITMFSKLDDVGWVINVCYYKKRLCEVNVGHLDNFLKDKEVWISNLLFWLTCGYKREATDFYMVLVRKAFFLYFCLLILRKMFAQWLLNFLIIYYWIRRTLIKKLFQFFKNIIFPNQWPQFIWCYYELKLKILPANAFLVLWFVQYFHRYF